MSTTTETGFYTLHSVDDRHPAQTACAACALELSNVALVLHGIPPQDSMANAALVLHTQMALNGDDPDQALTYSDHGTCEFCDKKG